MKNRLKMKQDSNQSNKIKKTELHNMNYQRFRQIASGISIHFRQFFQIMKIKKDIQLFYEYYFYYQKLQIGLFVQRKRQQYYQKFFDNQLQLNDEKIVLSLNEKKLKQTDKDLYKQISLKNGQQIHEQSLMQVQMTSRAEVPNIDKLRQHSKLSISEQEDFIRSLDIMLYNQQEVHTLQLRVLFVQEGQFRNYLQRLILSRNMQLKIDPFDDYQFRKTIFVAVEARDTFLNQKPKPKPKKQLNLKVQSGKTKELQLLQKVKGFVNSFTFFNLFSATKINKPLPERKQSEQLAQQISQVNFSFSRNDK